MTAIMAPQKLIHVYYYRAFEKQLMGRVFLKDQKILFEYDPSFIAQGLELSSTPITTWPNWQG